MIVKIERVIIINSDTKTYLVVGEYRTPGHNKTLVTIVIVPLLEYNSTNIRMYWLIIQGMIE